MSQAPPLDVTRTAPEAEISLGRELRRAREVRGISIEQIAQETKINERYLLALEADRLDLLPGQLYARNFVRAVARTIGADEEELLDYFSYQVRLTQDFEATREDQRTAHAARRGLVVALVTVAAVILIAILTMLVKDKAPEADAPAPATRPQRLGQAPGALSPSTPAEPARETDAGRASDTALEGTAATAARPLPPVLGTAARTPPPVEVAAATGSAATPAAAEAPAPTLRLTFTDASWVEIQRAGDSEPVMGMKAKGAVMTYTLDQPVTLTILNSGGVSLSVDGQPFRPLGAPQEKRTLTVDRKNYQQYLKR